MSNGNWNEVLEYLQPKPPLFCPETPSVTQKVFLRSNHVEALFGGAAGGGKSSALLMSALQYVDIPGYTAILFRRTYADLALPGALMDRFLSWKADYPEVKWNANSYTATFPSTARLAFGYLNNKTDYLRYKSAEFQFVGMDEVTEIREYDYRYLFSRLRRPDSGPASTVPLRMRAASNPAPNWVRQRFLVEGPEKGRIFVPSRLEDNPGIQHASYRRMLQELSPVERAQLEDGDWWATAIGTMFLREDFITIDHGDLPTFVSPRFVRFWDLAGTKPSESNSDPDWTVGVLVAYDQGKTYVLDVTRIREESHAVEQLVAATAASDGPLVPIRVEQEPGSAGKSLANMYSRNVVPGYDFKAFPSTGDKVTRAKPASSAVSNGNVYIVRAPWNGDFLDELSAFPTKGVHDDQVDAFSSAFAHAAGIDMKTRRKIRIIV